MAFLTLTTGNGYNNANTHIVGYESSRFRYEYFDFTVPETVPDTGAPIISARITSGYLNAYGQYFAETLGNSGAQVIYFEIEQKGKNENHRLGYVDFSGGAWGLPNLIVQDTSYILKPGITYQLCFYVTNANYYWRYFPNWGSGAQTVLGLEYESYTNCTAPTSITLTPAIQKRGGKVTVKWSGATSGISNNIKNYQLQYKIGNGTWTELSSSITSSTSSYEITIPSNATQGAYIQARVKTLGTVSGYDSDWAESSSSSSKVNTVPGAPTVTLPSSVLPSGGGSLIAKVSCGSDPENGKGQTTRLKVVLNGVISYYSNTTTQLTLSTAGTYTFYTTDDLEDSSAVVKVITSNSKPSVSITKTGGENVTKYTASGNTSYCYEPIFTITPSNGGSTNTYKCTLLYGASSSSLNKSKDITELLENNLIKIIDIRKLIDGSGSYRIKVERYDGIETCTTQSSILNIPSPNSIYQLSNGTSVLSSYFSDNIYPTYYKDEGYDKVRIRINNNDNYIYSPWLSSNGNFSAATVSNVNTTWAPYGSSVKFEFTLMNSKTGYISNYTSSLTLTRISYNSNFEKSLNWNGEINPYKATSNTLSFLNLFDYAPINNNQTTILNTYGFTSAPTYTLKATYKDSSMETSNFTISYVDSDNVNLTISGSEIYNLFSGLGMVKKSNTIYDVKVSIKTSNIFGKTYESEITKKVTWATDPEISVSSFSIGGLTSPTFIKEGMNLGGTLTIKSYHGDLHQVQVKGTKNNIVFYSQYFTPSGVISNEATSQTAVSNTYNLSQANLKITEQLNDITTTDAIKIEFIATNSLGRTYTYSQNISSCKVYKHTIGEIKLAEVKYDENDQGIGSLNYSFQITDLGISDNLINYSKITKASIIINEDEKDITSSVLLNKNEQSKTLSYNFEDSQFKKIYLAITVTSYSNTSKTSNALSKTFYSSEYAAYNLTPTVSYRRNHLGINVLDPSAQTDSILTIGETSGRNKIYYQGGSTEYCMVVNFHLDGGTW